MGADAAGGGGVCRVDVATRGGGGGGGARDSASARIRIRTLPRTLGSSVWAEKERAFFAEREGEGGSAEGPLVAPRAAREAVRPRAPRGRLGARAEAEAEAAAFGLGAGGGGGGESGGGGEGASRRGRAPRRGGAIGGARRSPRDAAPPADAHLRAEDSDWSDAAFDAASSPIDADAFDTPTLLDLESDGDGFRVAPRTPESEPPTPSPEPSPEHPYALYRDEEGTLRRTASVPAKLDGRARGSEDEDEADAAGGRRR